MTKIEKEKLIVTPDGDVITYTIRYQENRNKDITARSALSIKPVIVLIHGLASNMTRWTEFVSNTMLTTNVDLVRLDLKGHGKSMSYKRISTRDWCIDILQIIKLENYSHVILIGHSLGAKIAMQFADDYSSLTMGIILIDPVFPAALTGTLKVVNQFRYLLLLIIYPLLLKAKMGFYNKKIPYRDLYELDKKTRDFLKNNSSGDIAKLYMNPFEDLRYIPFVNYCQDIFEVTRKTPDLSQIQCAVLCLLSKGATISSINITQSYVNQFPSSEINVIDADHWLLTEKPLESRQAIEQWCAKVLKNNNKI